MTHTPNELAHVKLACGRWYLEVAGLAIAMEGDKCRCELPEDVLPAIPKEELEHASIGGKPAKDMPIEIVRFFRGDAWDRKMLEHVAERINKAAAA